MVSMASLFALRLIICSRIYLEFSRVTATLSQSSQFGINASALAAVSEDFDESVDHAMGYGSTELLCSLLFKCDAWKVNFDRHVYASRLYEREGFPLEIWHDQEGLDWCINFQAIFKADNPELLRDMFLNPDKIFQEGKKSFTWKRPTIETSTFIKKHTRRLILRYDSARILKALHSPEFADLAILLLRDERYYSMYDVIKSNLAYHCENLHTTGCNWKLRTMLGVSHLPCKLTHDHLEYALEHGFSGSFKKGILLKIFTQDHEWGLEMLHEKNALGDSVTMKYIGKAVRSGCHKILRWVYDRTPEQQLATLKERVENLAYQCPSKALPLVLTVHKSIFPEYVPSKHLIHKKAENREFLDFLDNFEPPLCPSRESVLEWTDFNLKLRIYVANPTWTISDDEIREATRKDHLEFVEHALKMHSRVIEDACSLRLIRHNEGVNSEYVPSNKELTEAFNNDGAELVSWLYKSKRFQALFERSFHIFTTKAFKSFDLIKWLWENNNVEPSEWELKHFIEAGNLEACEWALLEFKDMFLQVGARAGPLEKEAIQWWCEEINKEFVPDVYKTLRNCAYRCNVEDARWVLSKWPFDLDQKELSNIYSGLKYCSHNIRLDFVELLYMRNVRNLKRYQWRGIPEYLELRKRPNLKRLLAEHASRPISMSKWEFAISMPDVYGIDLELLEELLARNEKGVLELLNRYGHLDKYKEVEEKITEKFAELNI